MLSFPPLPFPIAAVFLFEMRRISILTDTEFCIEIRLFELNFRVFMFVPMSSEEYRTNTFDEILKCEETIESASK